MAALVLSGLGMFVLVHFAQLPELDRQPLIWFSASWALALFLLIATSVAGFRSALGQGQAEQQLQQMTQLQQGILNSAGPIMIACDLQGDLLIFNPAAEKTLGYSQEEAIGRLKMEDLFAEGEWERASEDTASAAKPVPQQMDSSGLPGGKARRIEMEFRRKDGSRFPTVVDLSVMSGPSGARNGLLVVATDLSATRRAEQALRESEDRYRDIFENSTEMVATISPQGRYLYVNPAWQAHFGQTSESFQDLIGFESAFPPEIQAEAAALFRRALNGDRTERAPLKLRSIEGPAVEVEAALSCRQEDGQPVFVRCALRDVTPRNRRERRLALHLKVSQIVGESTLQEEALPRVLDSLGGSLGWDCACLWMADEDQKQLRFRYAWTSPGRVYTEFLRETTTSIFSRGQGLPGVVWAHGSPVWMADLSEDPSFCRRDSARMDGLATGWGVPVRVGNRVIGVIEFFSRQRQREDREMMATVETVCASLGQFIARSTQEGRVHELDRQKEFILNSVASGILGTDAEGKVVFANPAAAEMLGLPAARLIGRTMHSIVHDGKPGTKTDPEPCSGECRTLRAFSSREAVSGQDVFYRNDGTPFPVEFSVTPMVEFGLAAGSVASFRDVSQRDALDRMKDEFISTVSHELRTPLTSIRGALGLLSAGLLGEMSDKAANLLRIAVSNSDRLVCLINDILDLERLQSGRAPLSIQTCALNEVVRQAIDHLNPMAEAAQVLVTAESSPVDVDADSDRLLQVVTNLLSNAIKFSPPESVVSVKIARTAEGVTLTVTDQGRGIPMDKLESIFDRFQQVDVSDARQRGGTGLGLAICRTIVHQHGGRIWAQPNPEGGSIFSMFLPSHQDTPRAGLQELTGTGNGFKQPDQDPQASGSHMKALDIADSP